MDKIDFKKQFGQNFIFDTNLLERIVDDAEVDENTVVLEIGCGAGTLTRQIAKRVKRVVGYEIDKNLYPILQENLQDLENVDIVFKDIMKEDIVNLEANLGEKYVIIANLPYYITTPILFKFLNEATNLTRFVIMVQLEVAERLCAKANSSNYGAITVEIDSVANSKITRIVKKNMFTPIPKVDSAIVKIEFVDKYNIKNKGILQNLIRGAFQMRRKTLANNLKNTFHFSQETVDDIYSKMGLDLTIRGESLTTMQFVEMANIIADF